MDGTTIAMFGLTWAQIIPLYFYLGRVMGELRRIKNGIYNKERKL